MHVLVRGNPPDQPTPFLESLAASELILIHPGEEAIQQGERVIGLDWLGREKFGPAIADWTRQRNWDDECATGFKDGRSKKKRGSRAEKEREIGAE
ncbi:hypothetical protein LINGRAHAP2_LOCUS3113 [Linum grandiflorum]